MLIERAKDIGCCQFWEGQLVSAPVGLRTAFCYPDQLSMADTNTNLKERVRAFWQANPCGVKFADAAPGTRHFYELVEAHRYTKEWHIPIAADFQSARGLKVLEIGCGLGTDGAQYAEAGADYTGVDLTDAAVDLARKRFELFDLPGKFQTADAERLDFADESFDLVYSHGVLHHTPETQKAIDEVHRVLRPGGRAVVMLYHRDSYNYRINISILRRVGARLLNSEAGSEAGPSADRRTVGLLETTCQTPEDGETVVSFARRVFEPEHRRRRESVGPCVFAPGSARVVQEVFGSDFENAFS